MQFSSPKAPTENNLPTPRHPASKHNQIVLRKLQQESRVRASLYN